MIKLEHTVLASPEQMEFIIEGMRNPMNSWEYSDSKIGYGPVEEGNMYHTQLEPVQFLCGFKDYKLMQRLSAAGTDHRKFMRMMPVYIRITAPLYWWKEFDTYKVGTVANSCSTMHKITAKEFDISDFSFEYLNADFTTSTSEDIVNFLNCARREFLETNDKQYWWDIIQLLPSSYNQTRNVMLNYEVLANIYKSRKDHKLDEWRDFCKWIEELPYSELICGDIENRSCE